MQAMKSEMISNESLKQDRTFAAWLTHWCSTRWESRFCFALCEIFM